MYVYGVSPLALARCLDVSVSDVMALRQGDSPDAATVSKLARVFPMSGKFWSMVYAPPSAERDAVLSDVITYPAAA